MPANVSPKCGDLLVETVKIAAAEKTNSVIMASDCVIIHNLIDNSLAICEKVV